MINILKVVYVISFIKNALPDGNSLVRMGRSSSNECGSSLEISDCGFISPMTLSKKEENRIRAKYTPGDYCKLDRTIFDWVLFKNRVHEVRYDNYINRDMFVIRPYTIETGHHAFVLFVREIHVDPSESTTGPTPAVCLFYIKPELPIPQIRGGSEITAISGEKLEISGEESIDMDVASGEPDNLEFKWTCTATGVPDEFCSKDLGNKWTITIPRRLTPASAVYNITLSVKTVHTKWQRTSQIIHFQRSVSSIEIRCLKNCPPVALRTNSKELTILQVECLKHCRGVSKTSFEWSINIPDFDYNTNTKGGRNTDVFQINENVLEPGSKYIVNATIKGLSAFSSAEIDVHIPPKLSSCSITPESGQALTVEFEINCQYKPGHYIFEVYSVQNDIEVVLEKGITLEELRFPLGVGAKAKIKIIDDYRFTDEQILDVMVTSLLVVTGSEEDVEKDILEKYFHSSSNFSLDESLRLGDSEKILQVANSLVDDLEKVKSSGKVELVQEYLIKVLNLIDKVTMDTGTRARQKGALAAKIVDLFIQKPHPEIAALATKICKKSADRLLVRLKGKRFPDSYSDETNKSTTMLSKCSQASVEMNLDVLKSDIKAPEISTPYPLLDIPVIVEDYPDYVDDQNTSKAMNNFDISSSSMIKLCYINSKKLALTMSTQEDTTFVTVTYLNLTSTIKIGNEMADTRIESHKVVLVPSTDFLKLKSEVHIAMCTCTRNIFWWTQKEKIYTSIAMIQFNVDEEPVTKFKSPYTIHFLTSSNITNETKSHESITPRVPDSNVPVNELNFEKLSVHRIDAYREQSFIIEFENISGDTILDVVTTNFYKPDYEEFLQKAEQVDKTNYKLYISNKKPYDSWYYLAVMPNSKMGSSDIHYKFSVYTLSCFSWDEENTKWKFACASTKISTKSRIMCECYQSSALVAMLVNNGVKIEETVIEELELETQACYIILISVVVAFFLYCVFFTWFSGHPEAKVLEKEIYFLGDIPNSYRYGYILLVKTGNKANAGTTSNVTIKMYGTKSESKEHVINYPDPEKRFLRRNDENWFFIATEFYLGNIKKIDIWFDSIGYRPSWFCTELEIFDLQQNKYWLFEVNKWFRILTNEQILYTAFPTVSKNVAQKKAKALNLFKKVSNSFRGAHMWNLLTYEHQDISRMKRLHIIYSIFLTTYLIGLFLFGCPRLDDGDSLSYTLNYGIDKYVILITIACFVLTFFVHFPIVWFFRYPRKDIFSQYQNFLRNYRINTDSLCWSFLITNIVISMTLLVILGFWVPHVTGLLWLTSVIISLLVYIFIMENIMRIIFNFTTNQQTRVEKIFIKIRSSLDTVKRQRTMLYKTFGVFSLRPYLDHLYKPLDSLKIKEHKYWESIREKLWEILEDLIMITIYVTLLYLVVLMDRDVMTYLSQLEVEELVRGIHSRTVLLEEVLHRTEIEEFISDTLIFTMQSLQWYGKYVANDPGMTIDNANKYLGIARLRQHRTKNVSCHNFVNLSYCHPLFFWHSESRDFSEGWMGDELSNKFSRMDTVWDYVNFWQDGTVSYVGEFTVYPGGGYIATLGRTMQNSIVNFNYLMRNMWIDNLSRCIFLEFLLYNPCSNLFSSVRIVFEISATGYVRPQLNVHTAKLLIVKEKTGLVVWIILLAFIIMLTILIIKITYRLIRKRKLVLKDIWLLLDIVIIVMSMTCLGLYVARSEVVSTFLSRVENAKNNEFVNYFHLMYTERTLTIVASILVFLATFRLWKLMRFLLIVKIAEKTLLLSLRPLLCLFLCQFLIILASTFFAVLKYGDQSQDFKAIGSSISTLYLISLNLHRDFHFLDIKGSLGYIFYSLFMITMLSVYTLYIAIITISYLEANFYYSHKIDYNVVDYVKEQIQYYDALIKIKWKHFRLRGGNERDDRTVFNRRVYPKDDEFRYTNCVTMSSKTMDEMTCITKCLLRNLNADRQQKITNRDSNLIKHTLVHIFRKDTGEKEIFFKSNIRGQKVRFVDDKILVKIANVVEAFLVASDDRLENERRKKLYKKIVASHEQKMKDIEDNLHVLLNVIDIDI